MATSRKLARQRGAAIRLHRTLSDGVKHNTKGGKKISEPLSEEDKIRASTELSLLGQYMQGYKKQ